MKHLLRLYPKAWRERYGEELEALLEERRPGWNDVVDLVRGGIDARLHSRTAREAKTRQGRIAMTVDREELRTELRAILAARDELGQEGEQHLVESFLDRLEESGVPALPAPSTRDNRHGALRPWKVSGMLLMIWVLLGVTSIAAGVPWSLGSTAAAQVFASAVMSGYALVLVVLLFAFVLASVVRVTAVVMGHVPDAGARARG